MHDGVEIIEEWAFWGCRSLGRIKLPGVRVIGARAFRECTALENVKFGDQLETIGRCAFEGCTYLRNVKIPKVRDIEFAAFASCEQLMEVELLSEDLWAIEKCAFESCSRLRRITMPFKDNLFETDDVFYECGDLSTVDLVGGIHKTVSSLLPDSRKNETNDEINRINQVLPNTPANEKTSAIQHWMERVRERIGHDDVFVYMGGDQFVPRNVRYVRVHKSVKIITARAFEHCERLVSIEMHDGVEIIKGYAFYNCMSLREIKLQGVRVIEESAFSDCKALVDTELGDQLEIIGQYAFAGTPIRNVKLPKVTLIGYGAFYGCEQLTYVELSEDLETIGDWAFGRCFCLRRIALPLKNNLLENDVFHYCRNLVRVDVVGSLFLGRWRNEMKDEIDRINRILPNTLGYNKAAAIRRWMERVLERMEHYKSERASDNGVMEDTTMDGDGPSFDQSKESKQQDAAVHREEDETSKSASSAGKGSILEDKIPEANEIEVMSVATKDDISFGGGNQNDDFHTDPQSDVSSEEERQSDFAQSTKGSEEESEIQRLKAQLKEMQKRLKESEEENKECESKAAALEARLKQNQEDKTQQRKEYESKVEVLEEENVRLKKKLKVSVQTNADLLEAAFKESAKIVHEPEVIRQLAEEGLMECLRNHKVDIGQSKIEGARFGAIAMEKISAGEKIFHFNGAPSNETISLTEDKIAKLPPHVQRVVRMYTQPDNDGVRDVPKNGFSFALGISWYLNSAHGTDFEPNVEVGPNLDESGFAELIAVRDIEPGEELLDSYKLSDTLLGEQLPQRN